MFYKILYVLYIYIYTSIFTTHCNSIRIMVVLSISILPAVGQRWTTACLHPACSTVERKHWRGPPLILQMRPVSSSRWPLSLWKHLHIVLCGPRGSSPEFEKIAPDDVIRGYFLHFFNTVLQFQFQVHLQIKMLRGKQMHSSRSHYIIIYCKYEWNRQCQQTSLNMFTH